MAKSPSTPPDREPGSDWGSRRRGTPPPPSIGNERDPGPDLGREPSERQRAQDQAAANEARLRTEWDDVSAKFKRARAGQAGNQSAPGSGIPDLSALFMLLDTVRSAAPVELQERTTALIREILMTLRALIDWYLERLDQPERKPEVQDIPID